MLKLRTSEELIPLRYKILLKHAADALPIIPEDLKPFNDYATLPRMRPDRDAITRSIHIWSSPIKLPTQTDPFCGWLELYLRDETDVWCDSYEHMWKIGNLDDLTAEAVCAAFCHANETELLKSFKVLADYYEAKNYLEVPF